MGGILCKCCGNCFGGGDEPAQASSSAATDVTDHEPAHETSFSATEQLTESFPLSIITPTRERLNCNTLGNIPEHERELEFSRNPQLPSFITQYLRISTETNKFFSSIDKCLQEARSTADLLLQAVTLFDTDGEPTSSVVKSLKSFKAQGNNTFPQIVDTFTSSFTDHVSRVQTLSELEKNLDQNLSGVECWKAVGSIVCCVTIFGLSISSMVLAFMRDARVAEKVLDQGSNAIDRLDSEIKLLLDKRKSSLEDRRDNIGALLNQAIKELSNIKMLREQTLTAIKDLDIIKRRVHEQVDVCIKTVEENIGLGLEEVKEKMATAMHEIKTEAVPLILTSVGNLEKEVVRCRVDLNTAVDIIRKAAGR